MNNSGNFMRELAGATFLYLSMDNPPCIFDGNKVSVQMTPSTVNFSKVMLLTVKLKDHDTTLTDEELASLKAAVAVWEQSMTPAELNNWNECKHLVAHSHLESSRKRVAAILGS